MRRCERCFYSSLGEGLAFSCNISPAAEWLMKRGCAKAQRMRGDIAEIVRKVFAIDGMPLVFTIVYTGVL